MKMDDMPANNLKHPLSEEEIVQLDLLKYLQDSSTNKQVIERHVIEILKNSQISSVVKKLSEE